MSEENKESYEEEKDCVFCKHFKRHIENGISRSECDINECKYEEIEDE